MVAARPASLLAALILGSVALGGCAQGGGVMLVQVAASTAPTSPAATATDQPTESPTQSVEPTTTGTPEPTDTGSVAPSDSPTPTSATPTGSASPTQTSSDAPVPDGGGSNYLPLVLGLIALAGAGGALVWFLTTSARRRRWDERMDVEWAQGQWVVTELVPALTNPATPAHQVVAHWESAQVTLDQLDTSVAGLVADAPDEARAAMARATGAAAAQVRWSAAAHVALVGSGAADPQAVATSAAALRTARNQLAAALGGTA